MIQGITMRTWGAPTQIGSEQNSLFDGVDPLWFVELTAYPQRSALEPLLTVEQ